MKSKIVFLFLFLLLLSGCTKDEPKVDIKDLVIDYSVFDVLASYEETSSITDTAYALYYYDSTNPNSDEYYEMFYRSYFVFDTINIYVIDVALLQNDISDFGIYEGIPMIKLIKDDDVLESYVGYEEIEEFFLEYSELDYSIFEDNMITDAMKSSTLSDGLYFEYYYSVYCSHCKLVKNELLGFFYFHDDLDVFLFDTSSINTNPQVEGFQGTPTLYVFKDNQVIAEYVGSEAIPEFIEGYNDGTITFD